MNDSEAWRCASHAWQRLRAGATSSTKDNDTTSTLSDIGEVRRLLDRAELSAVRATRDQGISWAEIATHLGIPLYAVMEQWGELDEALAARALHQPTPSAGDSATDLEFDDPGLGTAQIHRSSASDSGTVSVTAVGRCGYRNVRLASPDTRWAVDVALTSQGQPVNSGRIFKFFSDEQAFAASHLAQGNDAVVVAAEVYDPARHGSPECNSAGPQEAIRCLALRPQIRGASNRAAAVSRCSDGQ